MTTIRRFYRWVRTALGIRTYLQPFPEKSGVEQAAASLRNTRHETNGRDLGFDEFRAMIALSDFEGERPFEHWAERITQADVDNALRMVGRWFQDSRNVQQVVAREREAAILIRELFPREIAAGLPIHSKSAVEVLMFYLRMWEPAEHQAARKPQ